MPIVTTASTATSAGSTQRSTGTGPPSGTKTRNATTSATQMSVPITPSVIHSPIAERDSNQAGSRTGAVGVLIGAILPARRAPGPVGAPPVPVRDHGVVADPYGESLRVAGNNPM